MVQQIQRKASECVAAASRSIGAKDVLPWSGQFEVAALEQRVMLAAQPFISGAQTSVEEASYTLSLTPNTNSGTVIERWDIDTTGDAVSDYSVPGTSATATFSLPAGVSKAAVRAWAVDETPDPDVRYEASSTILDNTFGPLLSGKVVVDVGSGDDGESVVVQPDGKIVVVGRTDYSGTNGDFAIARLNVDGSLDPTFSGDGKLTVDFGGNDWGYAAAIQADGKILVVGRTNAGPAGSDLNVAMLRLNADGSLDGSFNADGNSDGKIISHWGSWEYGEAVAVLPNGKFVVGANRSQNLAVAQYTSSGGLDTANFNPSGGVPGVAFTNGLVAIGVALAVHPTNGSILVTGYTAASGATNEDIALARFTSAGVLDTTFDGPSGTGNGVFSIDYLGGYERGQSIVIQADDKIVIGGVHGPVGGASDYTMVRMSSTGALDNTFSGDGIATRDNGTGSHDLIVSLALQPDGLGGQRIVVGGYTSTGNFSVLRYDSAGTQDNSLDSDGLINTDFGSFENCTDMVLTPNGEAVAAGWTGATWQTGGDFAVARYIIDTNVRITPAAPTSLTATAVSSSQINLAWTDNSAIETGYKIERSADGGSTWSSLTTTTASATTYSDTTVSDGASYLYRVKGTNTVGDSSAATSSAAVTPLVAPTGLTATVISATEVDLAWTDNTTHETGYKIERSTNAGGTWSVIQTVAANATTFADASAGDGTDYRYRVTATNAVSSSAPSAMQSATTPLPAPSALLATAISTSQIDLTWTDNAAHESGYAIEMSPADANTWTVVGTAAANATTFSVTSGLTAGAYYDFHVQATNTWTSSVFSDIATEIAEIPPAAPSGLVASAPSAEEVILTWTDNSNNETGFAVERSLSSSTGFEVIDAVEAGITSYTDTSVSADTHYYYRVSAYNDSGWSAGSSAANVTTSVGVPDLIDAQLQADGTVHVTWEDAAGAETGYEIRRSTDGVNFTTLGTVLSGITLFVDSTAATDGHYSYSVRAIGTQSSAWTFNASLDTAPTAATNLSASSVTSTQVTLAWTDVSTKESDYRIERKEGSTGEWAVVGYAAAGATSFSDTAIQEQTSYSYRVVSENEAGESPSSPITVTPPQSIPVAPSQLQVIGLSSTHNALIWEDKAFNEAGFEIKRSGDFGATWTTLDDVDANISRYDDSGLDTGSYQYQVVAHNDAGGASSGIVSESRPAGPPLPATNLMATPNTSTGAIDLTWTDNSSNETGFIIERSYDGGPFKQLLSVNTASFSDDIFSVQPGEQYTYRVKSFRQNGGGNLIAAASYAVTATAPVQSGAPTSASGVGASQDSTHLGIVNVSWTDNSNGQAQTQIELKDMTDPSLDGMPAYWGNYHSAVSSQIASAGSTSADVWVDGNRSYQVRVRSMLNGKFSAWSSPTTVSTGAPHPSAPTGLTVTSTSDNNITLSFQDNSSDEAGFRLMAFDGMDSQFFYVGSSPTTVALSWGRTFSLRLVAYGDYTDAGGWSYRSWSDASNTVTATTPPLGSPPPISVLAVDDLSSESGPGGDGTNPGFFLISRNVASDSPLTVTYQVAGTASSSDYSGTTGAVTIPAGAVAELVEVTPSNDSTLEWTETVDVTLDDGSQYDLSGSGTAKVEIVDDDRVNISIQDMPEEAVSLSNEMTPGAFIPVNDDDDNDNGIPDNEESQVDLSDDDLEPVQLSFPSDYKTGATVTFAIDAPQSFRVWKSDGTALSTSFTLNPSDGPVITVYLEALAPASTTLLLQASDSGTTKPSNSSDSAKATAGAYDLDAAKISHNTASGALDDADEAGKNKGAYVPLNNDDDDYSTVGSNQGEDMGQTGGIKGEDDLLPIIIRGIADPKAEVKLTFSGVKVYEKPDRSNPIAGNEVIPTPRQDLTLYVEGTNPGKKGINLVVNGGVVDTVNVTVFTWVGPLNVPEYGTYQYKVAAEPVAGAKWIAPAGGTITRGDKSDVDIKWGAGPVVGKAVYQATSNYIWDLGVNVVKLKVETPKDGFTAGQPFDGGAANDLDVFSGNPGLSWKAKVTATGPLDNRGVAQMEIGFVQNVKVTTLNTVYDGLNNGQPRKRKASIEGETFLDKSANAVGPFYTSAAAGKFFPKRPDADHLDANVGTIASSDRPAIHPPILWRPTLADSNVNKLNLLYNFELDVVARTIDSRNKANERYPISATGSWSWDATAGVGPKAGGYVWNAGAAPGITAPKQWVAPAQLGAEPPKLDGGTANDAIDQATWPES